MARTTQQNQSVKQLIMQAYDLKDDQIVEMPQSLVEERFKLTFHRGTKQLPIYMLVAAKEGSLDPHLHRASPKKPDLPLAARSIA